MMDSEDECGNELDALMAAIPDVVFSRSEPTPLQPERAATATDAEAAGAFDTPSRSALFPHSVASPKTPPRGPHQAWSRDDARWHRHRVREEARKATKAKKCERHRAVAASTTAPAHSRGRGAGLARAKRSRKMTKRERAAAMGAPADRKICRWYTGGLGIDCKEGEACAFHHSPAVASFNRRRLERHAAAESRAPAARIGVEDLRHGRLVEFNWDRGYGFIEPDSAAGQAGQSRRRQIFFHRVDWAGLASSFPESARDLPCPVRFKRVDCDRRPGRWKAASVSRRGGGSPSGARAQQ